MRSRPVRSRHAAWALAGPLVLVGACSPAPSENDTKEEETAAAAEDRAPTPKDAAGFLGELLPLADGGVKVSYRVEGPGSLQGNLEIRMRGGGFRRQDWTLQLPAVDGAATEVHGSVIETPQWVWIGAEGEAGELQSRSLAAIAHAYEGLDETRRAAVTDTIRRWHADLADARGRHPGDRQQRLGIDCLSTRIAGQTLCLWEETGLPLHYESAAFSVDATHIERHQRFADDLFSVPASRSTSGDTGAKESGELLDALAAGNYAPIVELTQLRLSLPTAAEG